MAEPTSRKLTSLVAALDDQVAILRDASATPPPAFRQVVPGQAALPPSIAPLFIESERLNATTTSAQEAAGYLTTPAMCPQLTADKPPPPTVLRRSRAPPRLAAHLPGRAEPGGHRRPGRAALVGTRLARVRRVDP